DHITVSLPAPPRKKPVFAFTPAESCIVAASPAGTSAYLQRTRSCSKVQALFSQAGAFGKVRAWTIAVTPSPLALTTTVPPRLVDGPLFLTAIVPWRVIVSPFFTSLFTCCVLAG